MASSHAKLSASAAYRWLNCTPSARFTENMEDTGSVFATEGTLAHSLAELELRYQLKLIDKKTYTKGLKEIQAHELYATDMPDYVAIYTSHVFETLAEAKKRSKDALIFLEQKLDFSKWVPEGYGTGDTVIIADGTLEIIDLKYGKGVTIFAEKNPQMMLYGLGAWEEYESFYNLCTVRMTIVQPRLDNIDSYKMQTEELLDWAENQLKPAAEKAWNGEGEYVAGDHCKFCKAKAICSARADFNLDFIESFKQADGRLSLAPQLDLARIASILDRSMEIKNWLKDVEEHALASALEGAKYPGYKLVEGRSNRTITDEEAAVLVLLKDHAEEQIFNKKIKGITDLEKLLGKKNFESLLGPYIEKPPGKPTLVPESDRRPELVPDSAADDFNLDV